MTTQESRKTDLARLVSRCQMLCQEVTPIPSSLSTSRESFLTRSLEDAMQQVELILRVLNDKTDQAVSLYPQGGFLSRLLRGKASSQRDHEEEIPDLQRSQLGLHGNSWTIPLSDLIAFLASANKTGVLWVDSPDEDFLIGLHEGSLVHATSNHTPEGLRLGEIMVGLGYMTRRQLERFLSCHDKGSSGESLLQSGMISHDELRAALAYQVQQLFHRLIETRNAVFRFREGMEVLLAYKVDLNITQLLLESARAQDERSRVTATDGTTPAQFPLQPADSEPALELLNEDLLGELTTGPDGDQEQAAGSAESSPPEEKDSRPDEPEDEPEDERAEA